VVAEAKGGVKVDGHIVLLNTGLHNRHYPDVKPVWSNPGITEAATHWLADRGSKLHGVEGPSTDKPSDNLFPNPRVCRDRGIAHYEWLINLEELVGKGEFMFYGPPIKSGNASGAPVRKASAAGPEGRCARLPKNVTGTPRPVHPHRTETPARQPGAVRFRVAGTMIRILRNRCGRRFTERA